MSVQLEMFTHKCKRVLAQRYVCILIYKDVHDFVCVCADLSHKNSCRTNKQEIMNVHVD